MVTSNNIGSDTTSEVNIRDVDLFGRTLNADIHAIAYARPEGFTRLAKAIANNNPSLTNQILRLWGIR